MTEPKDVSVRRPTAAGRFYPADPERCEAAAKMLLRPAANVPIRSRGLGGVVPHAGWICSGAIAGEVLATLSPEQAPDVVVLFGAVHTPIELRHAALDSHRAWALPRGMFLTADELVEPLRRDAALFVTDDRFHLHEHAIEVELPLVRAAWPQATLLPVEIPAIDAAPEIGRAVARVVLKRAKRPVFLASSDLTHYGPAYRFTPAGVGPAALRWAKENDRRLLRRIEEMAADRIVPEVREHWNACGAGAIAAMLAACREAGATEARVLRHANSYETLAEVAPQPASDAVGYAGVLVA